MNRYVARQAYEQLIRLASNVAGFRILIKSKKCGFFGDLAMALNGLRYAELGSIPCKVDWDQRSLYFDASMGANVWEYFFLNNGGGKDPGSPGSWDLPFFPSAYGFVPYPGQSERQSISMAIARHCVPKPEIQHKIDGYIRDHFSADGTLGVHYRATDAIAGFEKRRAVGLNIFATSIQDWLIDHPGGNVFFATDDAIALERMQSRFGGIIHARNCIRSADGTSIHGHYDSGVQGSGFQKGLDVLIDASLLSNCDLLIHQGSRVTWFAMAKNPGLKSIEHRVT